MANLARAYLIFLVAFYPLTALTEETDATAITQTVVAYCDAWSEPDAAKRTSLLNQTWSSEGTYTDPTAHVEGRDALNVHIGKFFEQYPGAKILVSSKVDAHHHRFRFAWRMVTADGATALEGMDYGELDGNGRIKRIVGFFGPLAAPS